LNAIDEATSRVRVISHLSKAPGAAEVEPSVLSRRHSVRSSRWVVAEIRVGCSGWQYAHWRTLFYPAILSQARWFDYYASQFDTVEINNTFYRLPESSTFDAWRRAAPPGFLYAVKASRFLTHMKKLKDPKEPLHRLFARARSLGPFLGPVLYQLPPHWDVNLDRLGHFLRALPLNRRHAIEFRHPRWYSNEVFALLNKHHVACCIHDMAGSASGRLAVGPFIYARFHGPIRYGGRYNDRVLDDWATWLAGRAEEGMPIYVYFNNDVGGHAPRDAIRLRERLRHATGMA
jgi:uncharacterized protein YecE (DUF72 family)